MFELPRFGEFPGEVAPDWSDWSCLQGPAALEGERGGGRVPDPEKRRPSPATPRQESRQEETQWSVEWSSMHPPIYPKPHPSMRLTIHPSIYISCSSFFVPSFFFRPTFLSHFLSFFHSFFHSPFFLSFHFCFFLSVFLPLISSFFSFLSFVLDCKILTRFLCLARFLVDSATEDALSVKSSQTVERQMLIDSRGTSPDVLKVNHMLCEEKTRHIHLLPTPWLVNK